MCVCVFVPFVVSLNAGNLVKELMCGRGGGSFTMLIGCQLPGGGWRARIPVDILLTGRKLLFGKGLYDIITSPLPSPLPLQAPPPESPDILQGVLCFLDQLPFLIYCSQPHSLRSPSQKIFRVLPI